MASFIRRSGRACVVVLGAAGCLAYGADATAGKAVYAAKCKICHGPEGAGNRAMFRMLKAQMKSLSDARVQARTDADLKANITAGVGKMKPVVVEGADLANVVAAVRNFKK